jgi:hypothetical protein
LGCGNLAHKILRNGAWVRQKVGTVPAIEIAKHKFHARLEGCDGRAIYRIILRKRVDGRLALIAQDIRIVVEDKRSADWYIAKRFQTDQDLNRTRSEWWIDRNGAPRAGHFGSSERGLSVSLSNHHMCWRVARLHLIKRFRTNHKLLCHPIAYWRLRDPRRDRETMRRKKRAFRPCGIMHWFAGKISLNFREFGERESKASRKEVARQRIEGLVDTASLVAVEIRVRNGSLKSKVRSTEITSIRRNRCDASQKDDRPTCNPHRKPH